jgi:hypothetical protein
VDFNPHGRTRGALLPSGPMKTLMLYIATALAEILGC